MELSKLFSIVLNVGPLPKQSVNVLAVGLHRLNLLVYESLVMEAPLLALIDFSELRTKLVHDLLESLGQVVDRLSHELAIDDLLLIELAPVRVTLW